MKALSKRQVLIYEFIQKYVEENRYSPSLSEITDAVGLKSRSTTHGHLIKMKGKGIIDFKEGMPRTIRITGGRIMCG